MSLQVIRDLSMEQGTDPEIMWRNSLWAFILSNPQVLVPAPRLRMPDVTLTSEAAERFDALANQPHNPAASRANLNTAVESLKRRRARH
jgi:hypothetical protein